jgi:hypothetical protein
MVRDEVKFLGEKVQQLLDEYSRVQPQHALQTFDDVEKLWRDIVRLKLYEFETMQQHWPGREAPPEDSRWQLNWIVPDNVP